MGLLKQSFCIVCFWVSVSASAQITDQYKGGALKRGTGFKGDTVLRFLPLSSKIYKSGWVDFNKNGSKDIYEDPRQSVTDRVQDLLKKMTLQEKACQLATLYGYGAVLKDRLPLPSWSDSVWKDGIANIDEQLTGLRTDTLFAFPYADHTKAINIIQRWFIENTRLGIPVDFTTEGIRGLNHMKATYFPSQLAQACTFNSGLVNQIGIVTGREARALGYTNVYSPILDVAMDPRWGRIEETYGSDPFLVGTLGVANVLGLQSQGVASTGKHFAVYSIPLAGSDGYVRTHPMIAPREMMAKLLEPFRMVIQQAAMMGVMVSYNDYDGVPIIANKYFLTDLLRKRFGFKGYTVSDSHAFEDLYEKYYVTDNMEDAAAMAINAGLNVRTDFSSPTPFIHAVQQAVTSGKISQLTLDERVGEVLSVKFRLGLFDRPYVLGPNATAVVHNKEATDLALDAARQSVVLLKNEKDLLPLKDFAGKKIAVIGPNAKEKKSLLSRYGPVRTAAVTIFEGIATAMPGAEILYAEGCKHTDPHFPESDIKDFPLSGEEDALLQEAIRTGSEADIIILSVGDNAKTVGESASRLSLALPGRQEQLIKKIMALNKPVILVNTGGRPASFTWAAEKVPAIIQNFYAGEFNGTAVADVITGKYNPSGRLPVAVLKHVGQVPLSFPMYPADANGGNAAVTGFLYPFGHGLSYTKFAYNGLRIDTAGFTEKGAIKLSFKIKNTGDIKGTEIAQVYVRDNTGSVIPYDKELCAYSPVSLNPGEEKTVELSVSRHSLSLLNEKMEWVMEPGAFTFYIGASSEDIKLKETVRF
ncbi:MAG: glycoside hydrolase family 3 N-terminal domain-containing protein [Niabella sp.]